MPTTILMPALSPTMADGNLAKWHVAVGDAVSSGDLLAEIETDKAIMEFEAVEDGTVGKLLVAEGETNIPVNQPIAILLAEGEEESDLPTSGAAPSPVEPPADPLLADAPASPPPEVAPTIPRLEQSAATQQRTPNSDGRIFSSPLARRLARERNLELSAIRGSGPGGRIIKRDIDGAVAGLAKQPTEPKVPPVSEQWEGIAKMLSGRKFEQVPLDGMRRTIAARLVEAKQTIPHFYLRREINLDEVMRLRADINDALKPKGIKVSINDFIIKASALALQLVPDANSVWAHDRILRLSSSDVAVAVAVDGGLYTPIIFDAHQKSLPSLSEEMKSLVDKARNRRLKPEEYTGGSFSISNLGMFGIENFDAVINPPHGSILAVGAGRKVPTEAKDGSVEFKTSISVTLSCDHRVIDGALGAGFLAEVARHIESPTLLLL